MPPDSGGICTGFDLEKYRSAPSCLQGGTGDDVDGDAPVRVVDCAGAVRLHVRAEVAVRVELV